jgi:nitronate monooxygenase
MGNRFDLRTLTVPLIVAPMAGGPSTPGLAAAASNAGGLGVLAGGLLSADGLAENIASSRVLTTGPLGVNLFVPQASAGRVDAMAEYALTLAPEARRSGVELGQPRRGDGEWQAKLAVVLEMRPEMVSFTFDCPDAKACAKLRAAGIATIATVTNLSEARTAVAHGVDALIVQGPSAGGHRATFDPVTRPPEEPLLSLLSTICANVDVAVVAAGGLASADDVAAVTAAGAVAAAMGTAFLLADEAGTHPVHRRALQDDTILETVVTRSFTGRYARGLRNRFIDEHDAQAPAGFPDIAHMTAPLQAAAARDGDPHGMALWAGTAFRRARTGPVAEIMRGLT